MRYYASESNSKYSRLAQRYRRLTWKQSKALQKKKVNIYFSIATYDVHYDPGYNKNKNIGTHPWTYRKLIGPV